MSARPLPGWRADFAASPLFLGYAPLARHFAGHAGWPALTELNALARAWGLRNAAGRPLDFVPQAVRCSQRDYETGIYASGQVPSREDNWHDFFNALAWLAFPRAKAALNAFQHAALNRPDADGRGAASDAATLFDESGLILLARDPALAEALAARQWKTAFWERRSAWRDARLYVIGHSLLEKALAPTPGITGKCLFVQSDEVPAPEAPAPYWLDAEVARHWREGRIQRPAQLFPLPVWGVPGYHPDNGAAAFYDDVSVFRPPRSGATPAALGMSGE